MPQRPRLQLAPHVRACYRDGQVILLDLRRNKYLGVAGAQLSALAATVEGWPVGPAHATRRACPPSTERPDLDLDALTRPLLLQGLLADRAGAHPSSPCVEEATASLHAEEEVHDARVGPGRLYRFAESAALAAFRLRHFSLLRIADGVARRRARLERHAAPASIESLRSAVAAYRRLQPFVFTARDRCLHDSLALVQFLVTEGILASWVIGVTTQPFGAHSWVQRGGMVLNDLHEHVRRFQPILVV